MQAPDLDNFHINLSEHSGGLRPCYLTMKRGLHLSAIILVVLIVIALSASAALADNSVNLAGTWRFGLDTDDVGVREQWFSKDLPNVIQLPGVLQAQGYGNE